LKGENPNGWKDLCDSCHAKTCCSDHLPPFVSDDEFKKIEEATGRSDFVTLREINNKIKYIMKTKENTDECVFFNSEKGCTIYQNRPFDCKIFPFDIYKINGIYTWIVYSCNPNSDWRWTEPILESFEKEWLTSKTMNELEYFTNNERLDQSGKAFSYEILRNVRFIHDKITYQESNSNSVRMIEKKFKRH
jgi:Fe-S-cluster containining protein